MYHLQTLNLAINDEDNNNTEIIFPRSSIIYIEAIVIKEIVIKTEYINL